MTTSTFKSIDLTALERGEAVTLASNSGSRTFGNVVIAWNPSDTEASVLVTVTMGGTPIAMKRLTPTDLQMTFKGISGQDSATGSLQASFGADGKTGQLQGDLSWVASGVPGNYTGFIGAW